MFKVAQWAVVFLALASGGTQAFQLPDPRQVFIDSYTYTGSGCPVGSVSSNLSPDAKALTVLFDSYQVNAERALAQKNCQVNINMHSPRGYSYALFTVDYRGYADLRDGAVAREETQYHFGVGGGPLRSLGVHSLRAPDAADYQFQNTIALESLVWSSCDGSPRTLNLLTSVAVDARSGGSGMMTVDSIDGQLIHQYGVAWKKCPVLDPNEPFVVGLYKDTLGRRPSKAELDGWINAMHRGMTRVQVALGFLNSKEQRSYEVSTYYNRFLGRGAAPSEMNGWVQAALSGTSSAEMQTAFLSSPEFYTRHGSSPQGFVLGLFRVLFGREPSVQDVNVWAGMVAKQGRNNVASLFVAIQEHHLRLVILWYQTFLNRGASLAEAQAWANTMKGKTAQETALSTILASDEYFRLKQQGDE